MKIFKSHGFEICAGFLIILFFPQFAYAYLDPGTGSYILQVLIAVFLGFLYYLKVCWSKITGFLKSIFLRNKKQSKTVSDPKL